MLKWWVFHHWVLLCGLGLGCVKSFHLSPISITRTSTQNLLKTSIRRLVEYGRIGLLSDSISYTFSYSLVNTSESECQQRVTKTVKSRMRLWITRKQPWKLQKVLTADKVSIHCLAVVGWGGDPWSRKLGKNSFTAKSLSYLRRVWCQTCLLDLSPDAFISCRLFIVYLKSYFTDIKHFYFILRKGSEFPKHTKFFVIFGS